MSGIVAELIDVERREIESLLVDGNESLRQYHGITHRLHSANTNEYVCDMILLKDLVIYLNDSEECALLQESYDL